MKIKLRVELVAELADTNIDTATYDKLHMNMSTALAVNVSDSIFKDLKIRTIHEMKDDV